jgi:hypothetical protein
MRSRFANGAIGLLVAVLGPEFSALSHADEPAAKTSSSAEDALAKLGLKRSGTMLVLETESEVHSRLDELRRTARELSNSLVMQRSTLSEKEYQATLKELATEITQFKAELNATTQRINQVPKIRGRPANNFVVEQVNELTMYRNQLQWELNQRTTLQTQLKSRPFDPKARARLDVDVQDQRTALQQGTQELRQLVDSTREKYTELAKDAAARKQVAALGKETRSALKLGPSRRFLADIKVLEQYERLISSGAEGKGGRPTRGKNKR